MYFVDGNLEMPPRLTMHDPDTIQARYLTNFAFFSQAAPLVANRLPAPLVGQCVQRGDVMHARCGSQPAPARDDVMGAAVEMNDDVMKCRNAN